MCELCIYLTVVLWRAYFPPAIFLVSFSLDLSFFKRFSPSASLCYCEGLSLWLSQNDILLFSRALVTAGLVLSRFKHKLKVDDPTSPHTNV